MQGANVRCTRHACEQVPNNPEQLMVELAQGYVGLVRAVVEHPSLRHLTFVLYESDR